MTEQSFDSWKRKLMAYGYEFLLTRSGLYRVWNESERELGYMTESDIIKMAKDVLK